jgi:hypothetical protein
MPKQKEKYICITKKRNIMNLENQLLEKFQVEELEKRYEFAWLKPFDPSEIGAIIKLVSAENVAEATGTEADFEL